MYVLQTTPQKQEYVTIFKYENYSNHLDIMLTLVNTYIVDTNIHSLHLVANIIVIKRLTNFSKVTNSVRINSI